MPVLILKKRLDKPVLILKKRLVKPVLKIKTDLYKHQADFLKEAIEWERAGQGGLLGAEMGTGKTLMLLSVFAKNPVKTIVVVPLSVLHTWKQEIEKHLELDGIQIDTLIDVYHGKRRHNHNLREKKLILTT